MRRLWKKPALVLQFAVAFLCLVGWVLIFSASGVMAGEQYGDSFYFLKKQVMWTLFGLAGFVFASRIPYFFIRNAARWIGLVCILALLLVYVPNLGMVKNGARRWIGLFGLSLQPSEFVKIGLILYMAKFISERHQRLVELRRGVIPPLLVLGTACVLILLEPDFGSAVLIGSVGIVMLYMGGIRLVHLGLMSVSVMPFLYLLAWGAEYRRRRLLVFLRPWDDPMGDGFQVVQSLIALGTGGLHGLGIGGSVQKLYFLPYPYSDFIFAILGEETGLMGCCVVLGLYGVLVLAGFSIASRCPDLFGRLLVSGVVTLIALQAIIHAAVVAGMLPTKGLPLPLISFGGSSLVATFIGLGLVMNVARMERVIRDQVPEMIR